MLLDPTAINLIQFLIIVNLTKTGPVFYKLVKLVQE